MCSPLPICRVIIEECKMPCRTFGDFWYTNPSLSPFVPYFVVLWSILSHLLVHSHNLGWTLMFGVVNSSHQESISSTRPHMDLCNYVLTYPLRTSISFSTTKLGKCFIFKLSKSFTVSPSVGSIKVLQRKPINCKQSVRGNITK